MPLVVGARWDQPPSVLSGRSIKNALDQAEQRRRREGRPEALAPARRRLFRAVCARARLRPAPGWTKSSRLPSNRANDSMARTGKGDEPGFVLNAGERVRVC